MNRDSFAFIVPPDVSTVRFAANFDSWWHARDRDGFAALHTTDDNGQLALAVSGLTGHRITLVYTDRVTVFAIGCSIATQLVLCACLAALLFTGLRARRRRRRQ
jgi:hypothetical protein